MSRMFMLIYNFTTHSTQIAIETFHNQQVSTMSKHSKEARKEAARKAITEGTKTLALLDCCSLLYSKEIYSDQSPPKVQHP